MTDVSIQIGNSDNKLSQLEWSEYVREIRDLVEEFSMEVHFMGGSDSSSPYQNYCFVFTISDNDKDNMISDLIAVKNDYIQDSIAMIVGSTEFI
jgi:hypothetical protein